MVRSPTRLMKQVTVSTVVACLLCTSPSPAHAASDHLSKPTNVFSSATNHQEPMVRFWFPDAGAGRTAAGRAKIAKNIRQLASAGFGGAEIAFMVDRQQTYSDGSCCDAFTNAQAKSIGFGSKNWQKVVTQVLASANGVAKGFGVDLTVTSHWPAATDDIDPNDEGQQQESSYAYSKVTADDVQNGTMSVPLPTQKTADANGAHFIFVDHYSAATLLKVTAVNDGTPVFGLASAKDVSNLTSRTTVTKAEAAAGTPYKLVNGTRYAGSAAGVPSKSVATKNGWDYSTILSQWGPAAPASTTGKIAANGNRKRMADWQYDYQTNLAKVGLPASYTPSSGDDLAVGDYVLFGTYHRGTGQTRSGGVNTAQYNREYADSVYSKAGTKAITSFWNKKILSKKLRALLKANAAANPNDAIFEDSYELSHDSPFWSPGLISALGKQMDTDASKYAPLLAMGSASGFDDSTTAGRVLQDYNLTMGKFFDTNHIDGLEAWASKFGYKYKLQGEAGVTGLTGADPKISVIEGDNSATDDGWRNLAAAANLTGSNIVSDEATTFGKDYTTDWDDLIQGVNLDWAGGVNRVNLHGSPFATTFDGADEAWPGWEFQHQSAEGYGVIAPRQIYWGDVKEFTNYIARTQSVLQAGKAKVDVAVLEGTSSSLSFPSSNSLQDLLDAGYSYNILDDKMIALPQATVTDGVLDEAGPAYKALVIRDATQLKVATLDKVIAYAKAGLPVIIDDSDLSAVYGTGTKGNTDALLAKRVATLKKLSNVTTVSADDDVLSTLTSAGGTSAATYSAPGLETLHRVKGSANYYYLYSAGTTLTADAAVGDTSIALASASGLSAGDQLILGNGGDAETVTVASIDADTVELTSPLTKAHDGAAASTGGPPGASTSTGTPVSTVVNKPVTITGSGRPYVLDPVTGKVSPAAQYTRKGNTATVQVTLQPTQSLILGAGLGGGAPVHVTKASGGHAALYGGDLDLVTTAAGTYKVKLSDGQRKTVSVGAPLAASTDLSTGWKLSLQSWGPDPSADVTDPTVSSKTTVTFTGQSLGSWSDLPASSSQLKKLGVDAMSDVSGIGIYSRSFSLPSKWRAATQGAELRLSYDAGEVTQVVVNGHRINGIDQVSKTVDVSPWLRSGSNSIKIRLDTNFGNRVGRTVQSYGITAAALSGFTLTEVASN